MSDKVFVLTRVDRLKCMREGQAAAKAGKPSSTCPHDINGQGKDAAQAAAWLRGYAVTNNAKSGYQFNDEQKN